MADIKNITDIDGDYFDINYLGETRTFSIKADEGAVYDIEIHDDAAGSPKFPKKYYNFDTEVFEQREQRLVNFVSKGGFNSFTVTFPPVEFKDATCDYNNDPTINHDDDDGKIVAGMTVTGTGIPSGATVSSITSDTAFELSASTTGGSVTNGTLTFAGIRKYTINIYAKTVPGIETKHVDYIESRDANGNIDLNKSFGSKSTLLSKELYQDVKKNIHIRCIAPRLETASTATVVGTVSNSDRIIVDKNTTNRNVLIVGDKITGTGISAASNVLVSKINPDNDNASEMKVNQNVSVSDTVLLTLTPVFEGITPSSTDPTQQVTISGSSDSSFSTSFSLTFRIDPSRGVMASRLPTADDICVFTTVEFGSSALAIPGEDTSSSTVYHRWPVVNAAKLRKGMLLDPARRGSGVNTTTPARISDFSTSKTIMNIQQGKYSNKVVQSNVEDTSFKAVDTQNNPITATNRKGIVTAQEGNIIFDVQQADALKSDSGVRIFGYGAEMIKALTGTEIKISNLNIKHTETITTTTTAAVQNSTTIPITDASGISTASTVSGVNIDASVANPKVTFKSAATGAANLTVSSKQTLQKGQTLSFDNASNSLTITGDLEVVKMGIDDVELYFDVERFLDAG